MLVLSRRLQEAVLIGDNITVRVTRIDRDGVVRLSIEAPREITILREEIADRRKEVAHEA